MKSNEVNLISESDEKSQRKEIPIIDLASLKAEIDEIASLISPQSDLQNLEDTELEAMSLYVEKLNQKYLQMVDLFKSEEERRQQLEDQCETLQVDLQSAIDDHSETLREGQQILTGEIQELQNETNLREQDGQLTDEQIVNFPQLLITFKKNEEVTRINQLIKVEESYIDEKTQQAEQLQYIKAGLTEKLTNVDQDFTEIKDIFTDNEGQFLELKEKQYKLEKELLLYANNGSQLAKERKLIEQKFIEKEKKCAETQNKYESNSKQIEIYLRKEEILGRKLERVKGNHEELEVLLMEKNNELKIVRGNNSSVERRKRSKQGVNERIENTLKIYETLCAENELLNEHLTEVRELFLITKKKYRIDLATPIQSQAEFQNARLKQISPNTIRQKVDQKEFEHEFYTQKIPNINNQIENLTSKYNNLIQKLNNISISNEQFMEPARKSTIKEMKNSVSKSRERVKKIYESINISPEMAQSQYYDVLIGGSPPKNRKQK